MIDRPGRGAYLVSRAAQGKVHLGAGRCEYLHLVEVEIAAAEDLAADESGGLVLERDIQGLLVRDAPECRAGVLVDLLPGFAVLADR